MPWLGDTFDLFSFFRETSDLEESLHADGGVTLWRLVALNWVLACRRG